MRAAIKSRNRQYAHRAKPTEIRRCVYCGETFGAQPNSKQIYCTPKVEKRIVYERKRALVDWFTDWCWQRGLVATDMRDVARRCVEFDGEALMRGLARLGLVYHEKSKRWTRESML